MAKRNALIRRLPAVETLGSASVVCSDKTGTLTQNRMTLVKAYTEGMEAEEEMTINNSEQVKGAFDIMLKRCVKGDIEKAKEITEKMSADALRVLAVGYKEVDVVPENPTSEDLENGLTFMGLVGMIDPPRPEAKAAVEVCHKAGIKVVMITGDGVNDAPALKAADIGCAMGITATDVAKGAADMTLTDDNFTTIVEAVREGRGIYANIKKVVGFLLGTNIGEVISVFAAMILWQKTPFLSMQLLWINLVTDSLPAIALGMEPVENDVMDKKPKPKDEGIFAHGLGVRVVLQGLMFAILSLVAFRVGENATGTLEGGQTMAFMVLALSQVVQAFNMRSDHSLFKIGLFGNKKLNGAALISIIMMALVLFTPIGIAFGLVILPTKMYLIALVLIFIPLVVMEVSKVIGLVGHKK